MSEAKLADMLNEAIGALRLPLDDFKRQQLLAYVALLEKWNRTYNLTAIRDPLDMMRQHIIDCLAVVPLLQSKLYRIGGSAHRLVDVGSGAGLPGLVLAIALPELQVMCVDSVGKKASFIAQAAGTLKVGNAESHHARIETFVQRPFDIVASRALTSLSNFVRQTRHLLAPAGTWMAMKGIRPTAEIDALESRMTLHVEQVHVPLLVADRCVVWIDHYAESEHTLIPEQST